MKSVLINAYACNPDWGSEQGMGWNWIIHIASFCRVYVITEGEFREQIEREVRLSPYKENLTFYYLPIGEKIRKMCWNQGDWRFYYYYKKWQRQALELAEHIIQEQEIDIVHQLNMIGFREPGYLWKITGKPFVWGPVGGMGLFPEAYLAEADWKTCLKYKLKNRINQFQIRFQPRVRKAIQRADQLIAAIPATLESIRDIHHKSSILIHETGTSVKELEPFNSSRFTEENHLHILWVGRFIYFKQLHLALKTISKLKDYSDITLHIAGDGSDAERNQYKEMAISLGINDRCVWYGNIPHEQVHDLMQKSQLFFFTSVDEATSTVVLEAIENHLPVLCFDACGFGAVVDDSVGYKIPLTHPTDSVNRFAEVIVRIHADRKGLEIRSRNCVEKVKQLSWPQKMTQLDSIYTHVLKKYGKDI